MSKELREVIFKILEIIGIIAFFAYLISVI